MRLEGEIVVRLVARAGRVAAVEARAARPLVAPRLMPGRAADEVPPLMETLFAICGRSQGIAASAALDAARGNRRGEVTERSRERRIAAETLQEYAWRLLVDQPRLAGRAPHVEALAEGRRLLAPLLAPVEEPPARAALEALDAWARREVFGIAAREFASIDSVGALVAWAGTGRTPVARDVALALEDRPALGATGVGLLPRGADGWIAGELAAAMAADEAFERAPSRAGAPCETGALARLEAHPLVADAVRLWGRGIAARLAARLVEAALLCEELTTGGATRHGAAALGDGLAISWVETARGLLVHRARLEGERVSSWRIVAPTEWNFHPDGAFARGALGLEATGDDALRAQALRLAASLDPCVSIRCEVGHA